jgi:hypothetical protein
MDASTRREISRTHFEALLAKRVATPSEQAAESPAAPLEESPSTLLEVTLPEPQIAHTAAPESVAVDDEPRAAPPPPIDAAGMVKRWRKPR